MVWKTEEIMNYIIDGDSVDVAKAKLLIRKDLEYGKAMAELYVPNVMTTDRADAYKKLSD